MNLENNQRGFAHGNFIDRYGEECSIQKSSLAFEDCIWLGVSKVKPQIMASQAASLGVKTEETSGWIEFPIPKEVLLSSRMHLTREHVKELLPILQKFVDTGSI